MLVAFFVTALFAEAEQAEEKPADAVKTEESAKTNSEPKVEESVEPAVESAPVENIEPKAEAAVEEKTEQQEEGAIEAKSEEAAEIKPEKAKPEEAAEAQKGSNGNIEVEVVDETENFVFSARSLNKMTWNEAQNYCKNLDFWAVSWHLPDIDELRQIVRNCPATEAGGSCRVSEEGNCLAGNCSAPKESCTCERKAKNRGHYSMFGDADYIGLWSSSTLSNDAGKAWGAVFYSGMIGSLDKNSKLYARCVHNHKVKPKSNRTAENNKEQKEKVTSGKLEPGLSDQVLNEYFDKKKEDILLCVRKGLGDKDLEHGGIAVDYTVSPSGDVTYASVQMSTAGNLAIENCIASVIKEIKFPAPKRGSTVFANRAYKFLIKRKK